MGRQALTGAARPAVEQPHTLLVEGQRIDLVLRRSARRSLALQVDERGARVAVPHGTPMSMVERFVQEHGRWLLDRLAAHETRSRATRLSFAEGAVFPLFGVPAALSFAGTGRKAVWRVAADGRETLCLARVADPAAAIVRALRERALAWFRGRVEEYCYRLGLPLPPVRLSSARTRWGSCSRLSGIRLHWRLVHLAPALIDYVVAHEVAHLVEMNHSPRFWAVVEGLYPDWRAARRQLREAAAALPVIETGDDNAFPHED